MESRQKSAMLGGMTSWVDWDWWRAGKSRPCWIWEGCDVIVFYTAHVTCQKTGSGSKMFILFMRNCLTERFYMRERGPGPSVTAGVSCFLK